MKELSLHILDIVQNSIRAQATLIKIKILENTGENILEINIWDNGIGMGKDTVEKIQDPFFTTRTTRDIGLGIPLLVQATKECNGSFNIKSEVGKGTFIKASFMRNHIDRAPIGNIADTMVLLIASNPKVNFIYKHVFNDKKFILDTKEIKKRLEEVPITHPIVLDWIKDFINEGLSQINGGV